MEAKAQARFIRVTPQKSRRVVNEVRGKRVLEAADILRFAPQAVATDVRKVLLSAVANAKVKAEAAKETFNEADLLILEAYVDKGPTMKRFRPALRAVQDAFLSAPVTSPLWLALRKIRRRETGKWARRLTPPGSAWESQLITGLAGSPIRRLQVSATLTTLQKTSQFART